MDLSNSSQSISLTSDPDALAAHTAAVDEAAEDLESALGRFINAYLEYIDRIWPDEAARAEAHADLATLRADMTAARAAFDGLIFGTTEATTEATTAASLSASSSPTARDHGDHGDHGGYANAETLSVVRCLSNDQRADETARAIVATAWWNASDEIAADAAAIVAPRADAAEALREWLETEENPLAESASLFTDLLTHALDHVNWGEVADHFAPKPLPSIEPLATAQDEEEEGEEEGDPDADATATTDPADIEPGYLSPDDLASLRRARGNRRFFH